MRSPLHSNIYEYVGNMYSNVLETKFVFPYEKSVTIRYLQVCRAYPLYSMKWSLVSFLFHFIVSLNLSFELRILDICNIDTYCECVDTKKCVL